METTEILKEITKEEADVLKQEFGVTQKPVESRIKEQSTKSILREMALSLKHIWHSLELLAFLGAAAMLFWGGAKMTQIAGIKDMTEAVIIGIAALLFARIGWAMPDGAVKSVVEKTIFKK